jgi:Tfp pilus assembly protein PilX
MRRSTGERGAVLLVGIIGLIVAGTLVTALVSMSVRDHREGRNTHSMAQAFAAAEDGLSTTIGN